MEVDVGAKRGVKEFLSQILLASTLFRFISQSKIIEKK